MANPAVSSENFRLVQDVELPPPRSVDEFILGKARFAQPDFNDFARWNNRIVSNLLYFQTNYLLMLAIFLLLVSFIHPRDIVIGIAALGSVLSVVVFALSANAQAMQLRRDHPLLTLGALVLTGYFMISVLSSVIVLLFALSLPLLLVFVHASLRLRNLGAKVNQQLEKHGMKLTVMGRLLNLISVDLKT